VEKPGHSVDKSCPGKATHRQGIARSGRTTARLTLAILCNHYPQAHCALHHRSPFELLVATILSAQCTDVRVNLVTPALFARYPAPAALALATPLEVEALIRSTGFFRNKAANLLGCARALVARHGGKVPRTMEELVALPGVGRKTANVILGNAFDIPGLVVDTHVGRVARRLGWAQAAMPEAVERELCALLPQKMWTQASHVLIWHGRACCRAQTALCSACPVRARCPQIGVQRAR